MSEVELIDRFTDALARNRDALPPPGLDPAIAEAVRVLVLCEQAETLDQPVQARMWERALTKAINQKPVSGVEEHVTIVRPREHHHDDDDRITSFDVSPAPARPLQFPDARRLKWDPITLAVAVLAIILLGALILFIRANFGRDGRPEIEALSDVQPTREPINHDNISQLQQLLVLGRGIMLDMAWSPDGGTLALASTDGIIWLYDFDALDAQPRLLEGHTAEVTRVAFSPDGRTVASAGGDGTVRVWDVATGAKRFVLDIPDARSIAFSPDGSKLAVGTTSLRLWRVDTGEELASPGGDQGQVNGLTFSPAGTVLASASDDHMVRLWDVATGAELAMLEGHEEAVNSVAFSPNGAIIASGSSDGIVRLWDWDGLTGTRGVVLRGHTNKVLDVAFSPDGNTLASAGFDHTIRLWDIKTGASRTLEGHTGIIRSVAFSPDGLTLASVSPDETLRLWDVPTGEEVRQVAIPRGHAAQLYATSVVFSPDGTLVASSGKDSTIWLWDAATGAQRAVLEGDTSLVYDVTFSPDGTTLASASADRTVRLWDVATGESRTLERLTSEVNAVAFSPDGTMLASGSDDHTVRLWDVATGESRVLEGHQGVILGVAFSPDGRTVASAGGDGTVRLWDVATGAPLAVLQGYSSTVRMARPMYSPDARLLVAGDYAGTIWLWNLTTGAEPVFLRGHEDSVVAAFSPDGSLILSGSGRPDRTQQVDASVRLWDIETGVQLRTLDTYLNAVNAVAFSPDQTMIAAANGDGTIRLWGVPPSP